MKKSVKRIGVFSGTRADYGIYKALLNKIKNETDFELVLIVAGMHLEKRFGETYKEIVKDGFHIDYKVPMDLNDDSEYGVVNSMALEMQTISKVFANAELDLLFVLGDRFESLVAASAATIFKIPLAHIHGGELTEGLIDEAIRHSITKMSLIHFPATEEYRKRIVQMGEQPDMVHNVGSLAVESIKTIKLYNRNELVNNYSNLFDEKYVLVTYHPVTLEDNTAAEQFQNLLNVIEQNNDLNYVFTYANADPGGNVINEMIDSYVENCSNAVAYKSMGQKGYLSSLQFAEFVVGNSSSGLVEAPSFLIPTINIGDRQRGRTKANTVIDCGYSEDEILYAFSKARNNEFQEYCKKQINPYEKENTSDYIIMVLKKFFSDEGSIKKTFYDVEF